MSSIKATIYVRYEMDEKTKSIIEAKTAAAKQIKGCVYSPFSDPEVANAGNHLLERARADLRSLFKKFGIQMPEKFDVHEAQMLDCFQFSATGPQK